MRVWRARRASTKTGLADLTIGLAASFTVDPLIPLIGGGLLQRAAQRPDIFNANYNQLARVCIDPASEFGGQVPEVIVLLWRLEDLSGTADVDSIGSSFAALLSQMQQLRDSYGGTMVVALPPRPRVVDDLVEFARPSELQQVWHRALIAVGDFVRASHDTFTIDIEAEIVALGEAASLDARYEYMYRQPYTESFHLRVADRLVRICEARKAHARKCVIVDCDNTLWGGIVGEDGVGGLELSDDYPGRAYRDFQRQLRQLSQSGIFVALATKNNPADIEEVFRENSAMVLRWEDLAAVQINWRPKSENIRQIARDLNIGLDAVVFVDDNPFELEEVATHLPEVLCLRVPEEITALPDMFRVASRAFDRLIVSVEDTQRVQMVRSEIERKELHQKLTEADFLRTLDLRVTLCPVARGDLSRVTQLINKTNQFNLTTRRYSLEEVTAMATDPMVALYTASVTDRFGDYGLVGVGIVRFAANRAWFDTLLMSCRVLGRGVESAILQYGVRQAAERGHAHVDADYIPTAKNAMVGDLLPRYGFLLQSAEANGAHAFRRETETLAVPDFLTVEVPGSPLERAVG